MQSVKKNALKAFMVSLFFPVLYWLLLQIIIPLIYGMIYLITQAKNGALDQPISDAIDSNFLYITIVAAIIFFLIVFAIFKGRHLKFLKRVWFNPVSKQTYALVVLLVVGIRYADNLFNYILPQSWIVEYDSTVNQEFGTKGLVLAIIVSGLIIPITEETAFRGPMVTRLCGHMDSWLLVVLSGLTFALFHAPSSLYQAIMIIPVGLILCIVFLWTGSIRATIIMHMTNNILNSVIKVIPVLSTISTNSTYMADLIVSLVGFAVSITAIILLYRCRKSLTPTTSNNV